MRADLEKRKKAMKKKTVPEVEFVGMTPELQKLSSEEPSGGVSAEEIEA